ncbi:hemagglutinin-neuraminidase [avian paramyxovirus 15]|uniref:Hemagglutinin-neuraminidase n=1 Tax=avian paramyxovirus 15 TaxID=1983777 RepID=A0A1W6R4T2_9MONO|nr:hemagglutinin-neuraminidase [Avian paramyxovirus 15]ARO49357.1 hemagglutinin-neuraminidase [Avian paramyxovirus 15]
MNSSYSQDNLYTNQTAAQPRGTWRVLYRAVSLIFQILIFSLVLTNVIQYSNLHSPSVSEISAATTTETIDGLKPHLETPLNQINDIFRLTALDLPIQMNTMTREITSQLNILTSGINELVTSNNSGRLLQTTDPAYTGGIGVFVLNNYLDYPPNLQNMSLLEQPNFVPGSTTTGGCTRIPTFHLSSTHWCYSHNIIEKGCHDAGHSSMYISIGVVQVSSRGVPVFLTTQSVIVDDETNRKSCSIVSTEYGCDILCSIVTERESDDYKSDPPTRMLHGRLLFNGSYVEAAVKFTNDINKFSANYPGVGSGILLGNKILFPLYGGIKQSTDLFNYLHNRTAQVSNNKTVCSTGYDKKKLEAAYRPPLIGGRFWAIGIVICKFSINSLGDCRYKIYDSSVVMMGSENRLMKVGNQVFLYQRSSSWWPIGLTYILNSTDLLNTDSDIVSSIIPIYHTKFPRPTYDRNACTRPNVCPATCIEGVYADIWPLNNPAEPSKIIWVSHYLNSEVGREFPAIGVANQYEWVKEFRPLPPTTGAAYATTSCFKNTISNRIFCVSVAEFKDNLFGQFRIVPLLYEIKVIN